MNIQRTNWTMCDECTDIIVNGYTDLIEDMDAHQERCNHIDRGVLPAGEYWSGYTELDRNEYMATCESCGVKGAQYTCHSLNQE